MRRFLMGFLLLGSMIPMLAQETGHTGLKRNGIYTEFYLVRHDFSEGFVSLNYERLVGKRGVTVLRAGIYPDFETTLSFPVTFTRMTTPRSKHHFEYGLGGVFRMEFYNQEIYRDIPAVMIPIMYRYQQQRGFFFRGGINLFVSWPTLPSPSFSTGFRF